MDMPLDIARVCLANTIVKSQSENEGGVAFNAIDDALIDYTTAVLKAAGVAIREYGE